MVAESLIRCVCVCIEVFSSFSFLLFKDLHKNVYVTDRRVELLGCMYDDGGVVVVVVVHSVWTRNASGENVTLSFSLSFSPFSITVVLLFSLFSVINFYRFLFFLFCSISHFFSHSWFSTKWRRYKPLYIHFSAGSSVRSLFFWPMQAKTAAWSVQWLATVWQLHLMERKTERRTIKKNFPLALLFFFGYKITSRVSFITWGYVVYAVHDNDVKSAQKISRGCHRLCVCYTGWTKAPGYRSHMSHEVFIIRKKNEKRN
jgi:hypothetical protein